MTSNIKLTFTPKAPNAYSVKMGSGEFPSFGKDLTATLNADKYLIITDSNIKNLYADKLKASLLSANVKAGNIYVLELPAGEEYKNVESLYKIWNFAAECKLSRQDAMIALGGGVIGDITGFAASSYMRGVSFAMVPTTLLAMTDSAIGGKTAIDLPSGKNLAGAFYQPALVLIDTDVLQTLPTEEILNGYGEILKYAFIENSVFKPEEKSLFSMLENPNTSLAKIIYRCDAIKADVVMNDERESGVRALLNFGHTFAHALEKATGYTLLKHGSAVALGMRAAFALAEAQGMITSQYRQKCDTLMNAYNMPSYISCPCSASELYDIMLLDKKNKNGKINFVLPTGESQVAVFNNIAKSAVVSALSVLQPQPEYKTILRHNNLTR